MRGPAILLLGVVLFGNLPAAVAQDASVLYQQGVEARKAGMFEEAVKQLQEAAKLKPDDADIQVQLGLALTPLKRFDEAKNAFERALELAPEYLDAKLGLARLDYFGKRYNEAREAVQAVLKTHPDDAGARDLLAQIEKAIATPEAGQKHPAQEQKQKPAEAARPAKQQGIDARKAGKFEEAVKQLETAAKLDPDDADVQVELGLALTPLKRFDEAKAAFQRALELAPDYLDAKLGLARLDYFGKRYAEARAGVQAVLKAQPDNMDARDLLSQIDKAVAAEAAEKKRLAAKKKAAEEAAAKVAEEEALKWKLDVNGLWSGLTGNRPDWWEGDARLSYKLNSKYTLSGSVAPARRFDIDNTLLEARVDYKPGPKFNDYLFVAGTPDAAFFPQVAVGSGFGFKLRDAKGLVNASVLTFDARYARYITGNVRVFNPGLEQYFFNDRFWVTARWINVVDQDNIYSRGYLLRGDLMLTDKWRLFGGYADAPENVDANIVRTRSIFGGLVYDINDRTTWRVSVGHDDRVGLFEQILVSTGVTRKF